MDSVKFGNAILALADWKETVRSPADVEADSESDFDAEEDDVEEDGDTRIDELDPEEDLGLGPDQFDPDTADSDTVEGPMTECGATTAAFGVGKPPARTRRIVLTPFPSQKVRP